MSGEKKSTIRRHESEIHPGLMRYVCVDGADRTTIVSVVRVTSMPLVEAAGFLGMEADWPPGVMLEGMREPLSRHSP